MRTDEIVYECLQEGIDADRRNHGRVPFFRPAGIQAVDGRKIQGFIRDLTPRGVGLVHSVALRPGSYWVTIAASKSRQFEVKVRITWCMAFSGEWFLSGGDASTSRLPVSLLVDAKLSEANRRLSHRYPFFRSATVTKCNGMRSEFKACIRDISDSGVGLLHSDYLEPQHVVLTFAGNENQLHQLTTEIIWCVPCGEAYISGGRFRRIMLEQLPERFL